MPARPTGPAATASTPTVFAISKMYFGDTDRAGNANPEAWKSFGLNIDGKVSGARSTDTCTLLPGASCMTSLDGDDGIDNSFGSNLMPLIRTLNGSYSTYANQAIAGGGGTMLIRLDGLGAADSYSVLPGAFYRAMPTSSPLKWDGTDVRDVDAVTVVGGDPSKPVAILPGAYMIGRTWVGGPSASPAYLDLQITAGSAGAGALLPALPLQHAQVAMHVAADGSSASGTLSGVLRTQDVAAWVARWEATLTTVFCSGSAAGSIVTQITQASDILSDGTNAPGQPCDGISVGLGFDAVRVQLGRAQSAPPPVDPCADAGADAASGD